MLCGVGRLIPGASTLNPKRQQLNIIKQVIRRSTQVGDEAPVLCGVGRLIPGASTLNPKRQQLNIIKQVIRRSTQVGDEAPLLRA